MDFAEIALKEISEGKVSYELTGEIEPQPEPTPGSVE